ncbi:MAG: SMC-Scp complex subunit ScpB [Acidobacteria bacterium]|nr:SMC-Scp complex subunit ScpB [Acidobacteriota bacterium]
MPEAEEQTVATAAEAEPKSAEAEPGVPEPGVPATDASDAEASEPEASEPEADAPEEGATETEAAAEAGASPESMTVEELGLPDQTATAETEDTRLRAIIEAAIYITDEPLQSKQMAEALVQPLERIEAILASLVEEYGKPDRGLTIRELAGGYKMGTKAEHHEDLRVFVKKLKPQLKLSLAALETLAVIAYKQPITAPEIMEIRGVQGAGVLKTLLDRKLITAAGRKAVVGKPVLYKTTKEFLIQFGLKDLSELPTLKEFEELSRLALGDEPEPAPAAPAESQGGEVPAGEQAEAAAADDSAEPEVAQESSDAEAGQPTPTEEPPST